jgi:RHS repeat-associated protein
MQAQSTRFGRTSFASWKAKIAEHLQLIWLPGALAILVVCNLLDPSDVSSNFEAHWQKQRLINDALVEFKASEAEAKAAEASQAALGSDALADQYEKLAQLLRNVRPHHSAPRTATDLIARNNDLSAGFKLDKLAQDVLLNGQQLRNLLPNAMAEWNQLSQEQARAVDSLLISRERTAIAQAQARADQFLADFAKLEAASGIQAQAQGLAQLANRFAEWDSARAYAASKTPNLALAQSKDTRKLEFFDDALRASFTTVSQPGAASRATTPNTAVIYSVDNRNIDPPTPADLTETTEVLLTPAIRAKALELSTAVNIRNWVYNTVDVHMGYGTAANSHLVFINQRANPFDTQSLLIALLRAKNIPARYVVGVVEITDQQAMQYTGANSAAQALELLQKAGTPAIAVIAAGRIARIKFEHVWVEAYTSYAPSRGSVNGAADQWIVMDGAFKLYEDPAPMNWQQEGGYQGQQMVQQALSTATVNTPGVITGLKFDQFSQTLMQNRKQLATWAGNQSTPPSLNELFGQRKLIKNETTIFEGSLPYQIVSTSVFRLSAMDPARQVRVKVGFYASEQAGANEAPEFERTLPMAQLGDSIFAIYPKPATPTDAERIQALDDAGAVTAAASQINVIPTLKLGNTELAAGSATRLGTSQFWSVQVKSPSQPYSGLKLTPLPAGSIAAIVADPGYTDAELVARRSPENAPRSERVNTEEGMHRAGLTYFALSDHSDMQVTLTGNGTVSQRLPSAGIFGQPLTVRFFFGIPRTVYASSVQADVAALRTALIAPDEKTMLVTAMLIGAVTSSYEGSAFELVAGARPGAGGISAASLIAQANAEEVPILSIDSSNVAEMLPRLNISADARNDVSEAVQSGKLVIIPEREMKVGKFSGSGYIILDKQTLSSGWIIEGGLSGGKLIKCLLKAVGLHMVCKSRFGKILGQLLRALRIGVAFKQYIENPLLLWEDAKQLVIGAAVLFLTSGGLGPVVAAVAISVCVLLAAYDTYRWLRGIVDEWEALTPEERGQAGIDMLADYLCSYEPPCFEGINGAMGAIGGWLSGGSSAPAAPGNGGPSTPNPVAIGTGVKWLNEIDYLAEGPFPLVMWRGYQSITINGQPMGNKWATNAYMGLRFEEASPPDSVLALRADGGFIQFSRVRDLFTQVDSYRAPSDVKLRLEKSGTNWVLTNANDIKETYNAKGRLESLTSREGFQHIYAYRTNGLPGINGSLESITDSFGNKLRFENDETGRLGKITLPDNKLITYSYSESGNLEKVRYADGREKQYRYADARFPAHITSIVDERGTTYASYQLNAQGKVAVAELAGGANRHELTYNGLVTTVKDPLNKVRSYEYDKQDDRMYFRKVNQACSSCSQGGVAEVSYNSARLVSEEKDFRGNRTSWSWNDRQLVTSVTEAVGTPVARTMSMVYHPEFRLPTRVTEPVTGGSRITEYTHNAQGLVTKKKITAPTGSAAGTTVREWNYSYLPNGLLQTIDGPRSDVSDITSYTYNSAGLRATMTDALGFVSTYNSYNAHGQLTQMTDANGLISEYSYDDRQRLTSMVEKTSAADPGEITRYDYTPFGELAKVTLPDLSFISYIYDDAQRLTKVEDSLGHQQVYTLNANGDRVTEETKDPSNTLVQTMARVIDDLGRVQQIKGANADEVSNYTYDANGNEKTALDPNQNLVSNDYDQLDRMVESTDPDLNKVAFKYDAQDNLVEVSDPRQLKTNYGYNGFDELTKLTSPDTGVTDYAYDLAGNLLTRKDARNVTATYQYDAANRVKQISYPAITGANAQPAEVLSFAYDEATGGAGAKGKLTTVTDGTATTKYQYDRHGRVTSKAQTIGSVTKTQTMAYKATGQLDQHTLPSGAVVSYSYRADGRTLTISVNGTAIVREIDYFAFGEPSSWKMGPSGTDSYQRTFDLNGRVKEHTAAAATRAIAFDPGSRITSINDGAGSANAWTYGYDKLDRLKTAANAATTGAVANTNLAWTFDATGNRLSEARGTPAVSTSYTIDSASNKLSQVGSQARTYDAVGNTTAIGTDQSQYSSRNRLIQATKNGASAQYGYNAFGERVKKTTGGNNSQFVYDDDGHVLGEYDATGSLVSEYIWLGDVPVAVLKPNASTQGGQAAGSVRAYYIQPDHLDTPRVIVNAANQPVWRWDSAPFGETLANEQPTASLASFQFNLRFPGQQFDAETGSHYNYFRDYEAVTGRYLQSDPIGLPAGFQTYHYVFSNPSQLTDELGLGIFDWIKRFFKPRGEKQPNESLLSPGPWAGCGVPLTRFGMRATASEQRGINLEGGANGCHSCGALTPGIPSGNWILDHQPPTSLAGGAPQKGYPHCDRCSRQQGGFVKGQGQE